MIMVDGKQKAEHIHIAEQRLGRKIGGRGIELVHHIDGNKLNNDPENLAVMPWGEHTSMHHSHDN